MIKKNEEFKENSAGDEKDDETIIVFNSGR